MTTAQNTGTIATFFIGGAADKNRFLYILPKTNLIEDQLVRKYFEQMSKNTNIIDMNKGSDDAYFGYDEMDQIIEAIKKCHKLNSSVKIRLLGHSLGGWKAAKISERLSKEGILTALLVTIDPVGTGYFMKHTDAPWKLGNEDLTLPHPTPATWINILATHPNYSRDDVVADLGIRWHPSRDPGLKKKPTYDYGTPYSHAEVWKMMSFPSAQGKSAWQILMNEVR